MMIELHLISSFDGLSRHLLALCFGDESLEEHEKLEDDAFIEDSEEEDTAACKTPSNASTPPNNATTRDGKRPTSTLREYGSNLGSPMKSGAGKLGSLLNASEVATSHCGPIRAHVLDRHSTAVTVAPR
jgi:hypothetical protein